MLVPADSLWCDCDANVPDALGECGDCALNVDGDCFCDDAYSIDPDLCTTSMRAAFTPATNLTTPLACSSIARVSVAGLTRRAKDAQVPWPATLNLPLPKTTGRANSPHAQAAPTLLRATLTQQPPSTTALVWSLIAPVCAVEMPNSMPAGYAMAAATCLGAPMRRRAFSGCDPE